VNFIQLQILFLNFLFFHFQHRILSIFALTVKFVVIESSALEGNLKIIGGDDKTMKIFDRKHAMIEARDDNIYLNFRKIAQLDFIQIIYIDGHLLIIKVKVFLP